ARQVYSRDRDGSPPIVKLAKDAKQGKDAMGYFTPELETRATSPSSGIEWEECACPLCGGEHWSALVEAPDRLAGSQGLWFAVVQCRDCGLCFTNPRPSPHSIGRFYPAGYAPHLAKTSRL